MTSKAISNKVERLEAENERLRKALEKLEELAAPRCYWFAVEVFTICTEALRGKDD